LATLVIAMLVSYASCIELFIGFNMAQQKCQGRILALRFIPLLVAVTALDVARIISVRSASEPNRSKLIFEAFLVVWMTAVFYVLLYRFCKSKQAKELMTNVT
jgi:hypothetical protein